MGFINWIKGNSGELRDLKPRPAIRHFAVKDACLSIPETSVNLCTGYEPKEPLTGIVSVAEVLGIPFGFRF